MVQFRDISPDVARWQEELAKAGWPHGVNGVFGKATHQATLAFQATAGLPTTGVVGGAEWAAALVGRASWPKRQAPVFPEAIPFIQARCYTRDVVRSEVDLIVLHCMESRETASTAENCAHYLATLPADEKPRSAHYCVDSDSIVQCVRDDQIAWHAPGANANGIGIEHAGFSRQSKAEWLDEYGARMLALSAELAAKLCQRWHIPPVFLMAGELLARRRGITTHAQVSAAFHQSTHTDPGPEFPISWYIARVDAALRHKEPAP